MNSSRPWFERAFPVGFELDLIPALLARLRGTPARLEDILRGRPSGVLFAKPEGKWSALEHAGHLADMERLWLARVGDYVARSEQLTVADLTNRKTHEAAHNSRPLEEILHEFREARTTLLAEVGRLERPAFEFAIPHPRLKTPMRLADHLHFVAEHDDHHLAAIWDLVEPRN